MNNDFEQLLSNPKYITGLIKYVKYRLKGRIPDDDIELILTSIQTSKLSTSDALTKLQDISTDPPKSDDFDNYRAKSRAKDLRALNIPNVKKYVDIGCGNGIITSAIGKTVFNLDKSNIIGTDISHWSGHEHAKEISSEFTFIEMKNPKKIQIESNTVDCVSVFMALHHMTPEIQISIISEIHRILSPGGVLIIREHDCPNKMIASMINIEHALYEIVLEKLSDPITFSENYVGLYRSTRSWNKLFTDMGFETFGNPIRNLKKYTRPFYQMYKKKKSSKLLTDENIPKLRAIARHRGIKLKGKSGRESIMKSLIAGRRVI